MNMTFYKYWTVLTAPPYIIVNPDVMSTDHSSHIVNNWEKAVTGTWQSSLYGFYHLEDIWEETNIEPWITWVGLRRQLTPHPRWLRSCSCLLPWPCPCPPLQWRRFSASMGRNSFASPCKERPTLKPRTSRWGSRHYRLTAFFWPPHHPRLLTVWSSCWRLGNSGWMWTWAVDQRWVLLLLSHSLVWLSHTYIHHSDKINIILWTRNRHPIACPWGQAMGCLVWVQSMVSWQLLYCIQCGVIICHVITGPPCIFKHHLVG